MTDTGYFLSAVNPVANVDQRRLEDMALRLIERPELQNAKRQVAWLLREVMQHPHADQMDAFEEMIGEYVFNYAMRAAASDGQHPGVLRFMTPAHRWFGRDVPGSRWGADSPDFTYRMIPVVHGGEYEIRVSPTCPAPPTSHFALMGDNTAAPTILDLRDSVDLDRDADGGFVITVGADPADGRANHFQTTPDTAQIWVRDALSDWIAQSPHALTVTRHNPAVRDPLGDDELASMAAKALTDGVYYSYFISRFITSLPANRIDPPGSSAATGGMASQFTAKANVVLADDEAMIITASSAGALFRNAVLTSIFNISLNYWDRMGSLNGAQMAPDEDGRFTYVIAHRDPGVHNWLDTGGLGQVSFGHRWQSFPNESGRTTPTIEGRVVKFADLAASLPVGVERIDATGRKAQLAARRAGFDKRFVDC